MVGGRSFWRAGSRVDKGRGPTTGSNSSPHDPIDEEIGRSPSQASQGGSTQRLMRAPIESTQVPETQALEEDTNYTSTSLTPTGRSASATTNHSTLNASQDASGSGCGDRRTYVTVSGEHLLPCHDVGQSFLHCFETKWFTEGYSWKTLTEAQKRHYFDEFKKLFRWDSEDETIVYNNFCTLASKRYSDTLNKMKRNNKPRRTVSPEIYRSWEEMWRTPKYKMISETNSKNRRSEHAPGAGMSNHACGSRSIFDHKADLTEKNGGVEPTPYELFVYTHSTKDERGQIVPVCQKAKDYSETYEQLLETATQAIENNTGEDTSENAQVDHAKIFYDAVKGKSAKKRVYGLGDCASQYYPDSCKSSARNRTAGIDQAVYEKMRSDIEAEMTQKFDQARRDYEEKMTENVQRIVQEQLALILRGGSRDAGNCNQTQDANSDS